MNNNQEEINSKIIEDFLNGSNPFEKVISVEVGYGDEKAKIIYHNKDGRRAIRHEYYYPFVWAKFNVCDKMCGGNRYLVRDLLRKYGIECKKLRTESSDGTVEPRMENGYKFIFRARNPMSYSKFLRFFKDAGTPVFSDAKENTDDIPRSKEENKLFLTVTPAEQYMIESGTRLFKGYDSYDCLKRMQFDLETTKLDAKTGRINQIGIRTNRGFEKILSVEGNTEEEKNRSEHQALENFLRIIYTEDPDVIAGWNSENFDWNFNIIREQCLGGDFSEMSKKYCDGRPIYKSQKPTTLKLGGEVETFYQTIVPDRIVIDGLHAARRAQATDSNMLKADLKYTTKYLSLNKENRVYVPGDKINSTWKIREKAFAFNNKNGSWYKITPGTPIKEGFVPETGEYIVRRYLLDDLWETDKVEKQLNEVNFQVAKIVPTNFQRVSTMGTAGIWKLIILAWSYEHGLAIPDFGPGGAFTGGLSRLLKTGFVENVIKLDYNSLYPSIMLTWYIDPKIDVQGVLPVMLEYVLTQREKYKGLKKNAANKKESLRKEYNKSLADELLSEIQHWENEEMRNDRLQNPLKILGNSAFGSFGAENLFPLGSKDCAERITCSGRQCLRLMISWFLRLGYEPIVGDTDGFNFKLPEESRFRYTEEKPYIGLGLSRETKKDVKYVGYKADVAEFNDMFMKDFHYHPKAVNKMGLGIDEVVTSTINFSRKNYADFFPENPYPKDVKLVGNTIKSKKMPGYIATFLDRGIRLLLQNNGSEFLNYYYDYIEKIYNYQIPLKEIASKGKIKKTIEDYQKDCTTLTKSGRPKSRQAWYELCIKDGLTPDIGDTIYYINTGTKKADSDIKKITKWYEITKDGKIDRTKEVERGAKEWRSNPDNEYNLNMANASSGPMIYPEIEWQKEKGVRYKKEYELVFACELLDRAIIDSDDDFYCEEGKEYNVAKYIDMFNKRITPLLVCFSKEIRNNILISNPIERKYFTAEESKLVSGEPNNPGDEDKIEDILKMEDREIEFWMKHPEWEPPFLKECGMNWEEMQKDYTARKEQERAMGVDKIKEQYQEIIEKIREYDDDEMEKIFEGNLPKELKAIVELDPTTNNFTSKKFAGVVIGNIYDLFQEQTSSESTTYI